MAWVIYIAKALFFTVASTLFMLIVFWISKFSNSKATGLMYMLRDTGSLLVLAGLFQMILGFVFLRINVFIDASGLRVTFQQMPH